jgi:hypothetical protein
MAAPTDNRTLTQVTTDLARRWASQRLKAVQAYGTILADFGAGRTTSSAAAGAYAKLVAEESVRYSSDAIGIASDLATAVVRKAGGTIETGAPAVQQPIQDLELSGPIGGVASTEVLLRNPHDKPATLSFAATAFGDTLGGTPASVTIEPDGLVLAAGAEQPITVSAALDPKAFAAGGLYTANVAISGFDDLILRVRLTVLPS